MPNSRKSAHSEVVNGKIYVMGGGAGTPGDVVQSFDPATNSWATIASMPTARTSFFSGAVEGQIYAIGGSVPGGISETETVEEYTPPGATPSQAP